MKFLQPTTLPELASALSELNGGYLTAGCTDFLAQRNGQNWTAETIVSLTEMKELAQITKEAQTLRIGALCTHAQCASSPLVQRCFPALATACANVGCAQIRNRGTLGGSIGTSSPAGDIYPVLLALNGSAIAMNASGAQREIPACELVRGKGQTSLSADEALLCFVLPLPESGERNAFGKVGERHKVTISKLNLALDLLLSEGTIARARVALGAVATHAYLCDDAAAFLCGKPLSNETGSALASLLSDEVARVIAARSSMPYKREAIRGLCEDVFASLIAQDKA